MPRMLSIAISRQAWRSQAISEKNYKCDDGEEATAEEMTQLQHSARYLNRGKGQTVFLLGTVGAFSRLAHWFECDGEVWLSQCDHPQGKAEARACLKAAEHIRECLRLDEEDLAARLKEISNAN